MDVSPELLAGIRGAYGAPRGFIQQKEETPTWQKILGMIGGLGMPSSLGGLQSPLLGAITGLQNIFKQFRPEEQKPMYFREMVPAPRLYNYRRQ